MIDKRILEIKARLDAATPGKWVYDPSRNTHDCCIHVMGAVEKYGYISPERGGVIGSSEWTWLDHADGDFIANAKADIDFLLCEIEKLQGKKPA